MPPHAAHEPLRFRVFGRPAALNEGRDVLPGPQDHTAVLCVLALHRNVPVTDTFLLDAVWGRYPPPRPERHLREVLAELVDVLRPGRRLPSAIERTGDSGWVLHAPVGTVDLDVFDAARTRARDAVATSRTAEALGAFAQAAQVSAARALSGVKGHWLADRRAEIEGQVLRTWVAYTDLLVDRWDDAAPAVADDLAHRFPELPACWERLVAAQLRTGRTSAARKTLQEVFQRFGYLSDDPRLTGLRRLRDAASAGRPFTVRDLPASDGLPPLRATPRPAAAVRYRVLRDVSVDVDGEPVRLDDAERAFLAALLLLHPAVLPAELAASLVPSRGSPFRFDTDGRPAAVGRSLADKLTRGGLRADLVRRTPDGWTVEIPAGSFDLADVRILAAAGDLDAVLTAVPPDVLPGLRGQWFAGVREDLVAWRWTLVRLRAERLLADGRAADAVGDLEALSARSPHDEQLCTGLMTALAAAGRTAEVRAAYDALAAALGRDLGTSPGPAVQMLLRQLVGHE